MILLKDPLTPKEVAAELRVHPKTVLRWIKAGKVEGRRTPGGHWRIYREDLEAAMEEKE